MQVDVNVWDYSGSRKKGARLVRRLFLLDSWVQGMPPCGKGYKRGEVGLVSAILV